MIVGEGQQLLRVERHHGDDGVAVDERHDDRRAQRRRRFGAESQIENGFAVDDRRAVHRDPPGHAGGGRPRHAAQRVRVRPRRETDDDVVVRLVGEEERHRVAGHDLADQHPHQRADVCKLRVAAKRARQAADRQQPVIQPAVLYVHRPAPQEKRNRGHTRVSGEGIPTGDCALVRSNRERPRKIVLF